MHFLELLLLLLLLRDHSCHDDDDDDLIHQEQAIGRLDPLVVGQYALAMVKFAPFLQETIDFPMKIMGLSCKFSLKPIH
jgi:hypothetical protein